MSYNEDEYGQHIEREARVTKTGLTSTQRDQLIWRLHHEGWSQREISRKVGMTQPGVKYALDRLMGRVRVQSTPDVCGGCGDTFPKGELPPNGLCADCNQ